jgi:hypothetical protein
LRSYHRARRHIERVQAVWRGRNARKNIERLRRIGAASSIQAAWRALQARRQHAQRIAAAITLQNAYRCKVRRVLNGLAE